MKRESQACDGFVKGFASKTVNCVIFSLKILAKKKVWILKIYSTHEAVGPEKDI